MDKYWQVRWQVADNEDADSLGAQFGAYFMTGVEVVTPITAERIRREQYGEIFSEKQNTERLVRFYLPTTMAVADIEQYFNQMFGPARVAGSLVVELFEMPDYEQAWRDSVVDIELAALTIVPPWRADAFPEEQRIVLEPKMAFGTGDHLTTQLAARLLARIELVGKRCLDVGTGSGILAMVAARNGVSEVVATEIDEQAVVEARANVAANNLASCVAVWHSGTLPTEERFDVIITNITLPILTQLLPQMWGMAPTIVISGILVREQQQITALVTGLGYRIVELLIEGDWVALQISV